jgi:hypothetical protein
MQYEDSDAKAGRYFGLSKVLPPHSYSHALQFESAAEKIQHVVHN